VGVGRCNLKYMKLEVIISKILPIIKCAELNPRDLVLIDD
jgi:hypothetical protein